MKQILNRILAVLLSLTLLVAVLPATVPGAAASDTEEADQSTAPVLNPVIEGSVRFGSFHYLGDKGDGSESDGDERDGVDYVSPFYYSDDYFSDSAVNPDAAGKTMDWSDLENISLATLSKDFTIAAFGTSENTFLTNWSRKSKNAERFLNDCGFENIFVSSEFNQQTEKDSLGYVFGSKEITVWDQSLERNRTYTLVAVGVRGAGYGAEWASNLTIGDPDSATYDRSGTYRHKGFDDGAAKVMDDLESYASTYADSGDVKYWVCGFSRAGAIANLVAGELTDNASSFNTTIDDIYGYTYEAAAGALATEDPDGSKYPNIHNIINKMDSVPLVSPRLFNHDRLGVDYQLPYYGNTDELSNDSYYNNMWNTLKKVAVIADLYNSKQEGDHTEDPVITDSDPATYPYDDTIQISSLGITNYLTGGTLTKAVSNSDSHIPNASGGLYLDQYLEQFVDEFLLYKGWDAKLLSIKSSFFVDTYDTSAMTSDWKSHEYQYVSEYQEALRTLAGLALEKPGVGVSTLSSVLDNALSGNTLSNAWNAAGAGTYYAEMNLSAKDSNSYNRAVYKMISPMTTVVKNIVSNTGLYDSDDMSQVNQALETIMPVLVWIYCDEHKDYDGEYLGTLLDYVSTILVTHVPELGVSWLMSLDDVFISDYREITLPKSTNVVLYEFRAGIDDTFEKDDSDEVLASADASGAEIGTLSNGQFKDGCKDARVKVAESTDGQNITVRYPGNLDIRMDVSPLSGEELNSSDIILSDWAPSDVVNVKSTCTRAEEEITADGVFYNAGNILSDSLDYDMTEQDDTQSAEDNNDLLQETFTLTDKDSLRVMAWHGSNQVEDSYDAEYALFRNTRHAMVADYSTTMVAEDAGLVQTDETGESFKQSEGDVVYQAIDDEALANGTSLILSDVETARVLGTPVENKSVQLYWGEDVTVVPASSIYFDDDFTTISGIPGDSVYSTENQTALDSVIDGKKVGKTLSYSFKGSRIDLYCTTDSETGYVVASLIGEDGKVLTDADGNRLSQAVKSSSETTRYNVPTISFCDLDNTRTYTLKLYAIAGANYKLDGIRIYHPADESDATVKAIYSSAAEQDAKYVNLRSLLLSSSAVENLTGNSPGAAFYTETGNQTLGSDDYVANSPKQEVYLSEGQGLAFQICGSYEKVAVGLSVPENTGSATVTVTDGDGTKDLTVGSVVDSYYAITPDENGNVVIQNTTTQSDETDVLVSATNVKLSGTYTPASTDQTESAGLLRVSSTLKSYVSNFMTLSDESGEDEEAEETVSPEEAESQEDNNDQEEIQNPETEPEVQPSENEEKPASAADKIRSIIKNVFKRFSSLFRH